MMSEQYNLRSPAVRRLMKEAQELRSRTEHYYAQPLEDNLFEWHFTVRGPSDTDYAGGFYHGRIILPADYPMKPPSIMFLTENGRFETHAKICLSISRHHPETWQPSWSIRTALLAIIGFMPTPGKGAVGALDYPAAEKQKAAKRSQKFTCDVCGPIKDLLKEVTDYASKQEQETQEEMKQLAAQLSMAGEKAKKDREGPGNGNGEGAEKEPPAPRGGVANQTPSLASDTQRSNPSSPPSSPVSSSPAQPEPQAAPPEIRRRQPMPQPQHPNAVNPPPQIPASEAGSRSLADILTYYIMIAIVAVIVLLIARRVLNRFVF